jgi:uncharacterized protein
MAKSVGPTCNLACDYCYYLPKMEGYSSPVTVMKDETLERFTRAYLNYGSLDFIEFAWQGGEPLLAGLPFYRRAVQLQQKHGRNGLRIQNALQTNGVLLSDEWCRFFKEHNFLIGISLDGPMELHDRYRHYRNGKSSYASVMAGLEKLHKHGVEFNILTCVSAANAHEPLKVYRFFRDQVQAKFIQFIPVVKRHEPSHFVAADGVADCSVRPEQYGDFLIAVFDEWIRRDVGTIFIQDFDVALAQWHGAPASLCVHAPSCGGSLMLEHNGDLYSCDHFAEPACLLGNIGQDELMQMTAGEKHCRFIGMRDRSRLPAECKECSFLFACNGGCPKDRFAAKEGEGARDLNYLCAGYRKFFAHIDKPMRWMSRALHEKRAPLEIMPLMRRGCDLGG